MKRKVASKKVYDYSDSDSDIIEELRGQTFTSVPERDPRKVPPAFDDYSDSGNEKPLAASSYSDSSIDEEITTRNLDVNMKPLDKLGATIEDSDYYSDDAKRPPPQKAAKPDRRIGKRNASNGTDSSDDVKPVKRSPGRKQENVEQPEVERKRQRKRVSYAVPANDTAPTNGTSMVKREVAASEVRSMRSMARSGTSWKSAKTDMNRMDERLSQFSMNPEEVELEAERIARMRYAQMLRKKCPTIVQNKELLQRRQNRNFQVNANDDLIRAMSRPELLEMNKRLEGELQELDDELSRVTDEIGMLRKKRDKLKQQQTREMRKSGKGPSRKPKKPQLDSDYDSD